MSDELMANQGGTPLAQHAEEVKQEYKEKAIQEKAKEMDMGYVNLLKLAINPDLSKVITKEEAESAGVAPFFISGKKLKVATIELNEVAQALVKKKRDEGYWVEVSICSEESLKKAHEIYYQSQYLEKELAETEFDENKLGSVEEEISNLQDLKEKIENTTVDLALSYIQVGAFKVGASDVHFQPGESEVVVRFRIDGVLQTVFELKSDTFVGLLKEVKYLSHIKLNIVSVPQDGQYSFDLNQTKINVRVSTLPTQYGEAIVMRLLPENREAVSLEDLGFEDRQVDLIRRSAELTHGMILVTGPTGSGKSTTLYALLNLIDKKVKKVITLEDPIEYGLEGVSQSQINEEDDYTFAVGLRAILRQDPDVIMVGEIRDLETAETAAQASLTGHLVMSTLHTNSAVDSVPRLINMGLKPFVLAPSFDLIIAQRLVRRLCTCARPTSINETKKAYIADLIKGMEARGLKFSSVPDQIKAPVGCELCGNIGYKGQMVMAEVLAFDESIRRLILEEGSLSDIKAYIQKEKKMISLQEDGLIKVLKGYTTLEEVERVAG